jgi:hypothetical protein
MKRKDCMHCFVDYIAEKIQMNEFRPTYFSVMPLNFIIWWSLFLLSYFVCINYTHQQVSSHKFPVYYQVQMYFKKTSQREGE